MSLPSLGFRPCRGLLTRRAPRAPVLRSRVLGECAFCPAGTAALYRLLLGPATASIARATRMDRGPLPNCRVLIGLARFLGRPVNQCPWVKGPGGYYLCLLLATSPMYYTEPKVADSARENRSTGRH